MSALFHKCHAIQVADAAPINNRLLDKLEPFLAGIVGKELSRHETARPRIKAPFIAANIIRVMEKPTPAISENPKRIAKVRAHNVAIEMNHGVETINQCGVAVFYWLEIIAAVGQCLDMPVVVESFAADRDILGLNVH